MWTQVSTLPIAVIKFNVMPLLAIKDMVTLDEAVQERAKRKTVEEWLFSSKALHTLTISDRYLSLKLIWLFKNSIYVSKLEIHLLGWHNDEVFRTMAWLGSKSDEISITYLTASEEQLMNLYSDRSFTSKVVATCSNYDRYDVALTTLIATRCENLKHLTFTQESETIHTLATCRYFQGWERLESIDVQEGQYFGEGGEQLFRTIRQCVKLKKFQSVWVTDSILISIVQHCTLLEEIVLPDADSVRFTTESLLAVAAHCPLLRVLDVSRCLVSDEAVVALCRSCPQLSTLLVEESSPLTYEAALTAMLTHGRNLRHLHVPWSLFAPQSAPGEPGESEEGEALRVQASRINPLAKLESLVVAGQHISVEHYAQAADALCHVAANAEQLTIDIRRGQPIFQAMDRYAQEGQGHMRVMSLECVWNHRLSDSDLLAAPPQFAQLRCLLLPAATLLTDQALMVIAQQCPLLEELTVSFAKHTTDAGWIAVLRGCPRLTHLNASGCDGLTDAFLDEICRSGVHISHLQVPKCTRLTPAAVIALVLTCKQLRQLHLTVSAMAQEDVDLLTELSDSRPFSLIRH